MLPRQARVQRRQGRRDLRIGQDQQVFVRAHPAAGPVAVHLDPAWRGQLGARDRPDHLVQRRQSLGAQRDHAQGPDLADGGKPVEARAAQGADRIRHSAFPRPCRRTPRRAPAP